MLPRKTALSRFKRTLDGVIEFATLIEQAEPKAQARLIEEIKNDDSEFHAKVMRKVVFFEELTCLGESTLAELLSKVSPKILAFALIGMEESFSKTILGCLGYQLMKQVLDEKQDIKISVSQPFILGARRQILKIGRVLESQNKFVFELDDCPRFKQKQQEGPEKK